MYGYYIYIYLILTHVCFSIQLMCCKMLMNLVDCIRQKNGEDVPNLKCTQGETVSFDLLIRVLQVYVLKLKVVSKLYIPAIISKRYV